MRQDPQFLQKRPALIIARMFPAFILLSACLAVFLLVSSVSSYQIVARRVSLETSPRQFAPQQADFLWMAVADRQTIASRPLRRIDSGQNFRGSYGSLWTLERNLLINSCAAGALLLVLLTIGLGTRFLVR